MKILITGGAGFIGSHLTDALIRKNHHIIVVDDLSTGKKTNLNPQAKFYKLKIQSPKLTDVFRKEKPNVVFHLAAQMNVRKSISDPSFDAQTNILGSINLLENCVKHKIKKFIFISTGGAIYGDGVKIPTPENAAAAPLSPYGVAKFAIEKYLYFYNHQYKLSYTILRLANIYGPRQNYLGEAGVVAIFCHNLKNNQPLTIFGGAQTRDFVYVADVVQAGLKAMSKSKQGIYNVGTSQQTSINQLAEITQKISQIKIPIKHKPYIKGEQMKSCLSYHKINQELNWQAEYNLDRGLRKTWDHFHHHY